MTWNDHDHRGEYADDRHDQDLDTPRSTTGTTTTSPRSAACARTWAREERIRAQVRPGGALAFIRVLSASWPTCVMCRDDRTEWRPGEGRRARLCRRPAGRRSRSGPPGDLGLRRGARPAAPSGRGRRLHLPRDQRRRARRTWHAGHRSASGRPTQRRSGPDCAGTSDGRPLIDRRTGVRTSAPDAAQAEPEPAVRPGPGDRRRGRHAEHRYYVMPEDYERGQS